MPAVPVPPQAHRTKLTTGALQSLFTKVLVSPHGNDTPQEAIRCIFAGFPSKRPKPRTPRTLRAGDKNSVRGCFAAEGCQKRPTLEHLERSGEFKWVKGTEGVFEEGGPGKAASNESGLSP